MSGQAIHYNEKLFSNYKSAKVRVYEVHEKYLKWTKSCKNYKTDMPLVAASIETLGITISEMSVRLYALAKIGDIAISYRNHKVKKGRVVADLGLVMDEERRIENYKIARDNALADLKMCLLKDNMSSLMKQDILEMYINHMVDIFDLQEVLFLKSITLTTERILFYESKMSQGWRTRYSSQLRTKMFSELGEYLSDYFEGAVQDIDMSVEYTPFHEEELREYHFTNKYKNKVFAKGLKMCVDKIGKNNQLIEIKDDFTEKLLLEFSKLDLIKMVGMSLGITDTPIITHYEVKILPEGRRLLSICQKKGLI